MGVKGLFTTLKPLMTKRNLLKIKYKSIGIDANGWIYKALLQEGRSFLLENNINQVKKYFTNKLKQILHSGK